MAREIISKATRNEFREVLTGFTLHQIEMIFDVADMRPNPYFSPSVGGQRRSLVEQYFASVDFSSVRDIKLVARVFAELIEQLTSACTQNPTLQGTIDSLLRRMARDGFRYQDGKFTSDDLVQVVNPSSLALLTEESISEHIDKARSKIDNDDYAGAIASSYTLVEQFLKALLEKNGISFNSNEGDIRELYKLVAEPLNLSPKGESLESYLKQILQGLKQQISGLYEVSNKASDRHARRYNPARHHAKLAVNTSFTLCDFLLDSYRYQVAKAQTK